MQSEGQYIIFIMRSQIRASNMNSFERIKSPVEKHSNSSFSVGHYTHVKTSFFNLKYIHLQNELTISIGDLI